MKTQFDITPVIELIITIVSAVITLYIIPYIREKVSVEKQKKLKNWVEIAVKAAEQMYGSKTGQQKKDYVLAFLLSKGVVFDADEVTAMIESEVYRLANYKL